MTSASSLSANSLQTSQVRWEDLKALALSQNGVFTAAQALELGYSYPNQNHHVRQGNWRRLDHGIYCLPWQAEDYNFRLARRYFWARNRGGEFVGCVSHESALYFHGLSEHEPRRVTLTVPVEFRKRPPAGVWLAYGTVPAAEAETHGRLRITTPQRTIADLRDILAERGLLNRTARLAIMMGRLTEAQAQAEGWLRANALAEQTPEASALGVPALFVAPSRPPLAGPPATPPADPEPNAMKRRHYMDYESDRPAPRRAQAGFTLVELLVVIAIISILAGMLLPALEKALGAARSAHCANNLKQHALIFEQYADDSSGWYPRNNWQTALMKSGQIKSDVFRPLALCPSGPQIAPDGRILLSHYSFTGVYWNETRTYFTNYTTQYHTRNSEVFSPSTKIMLTESWMDSTASNTIIGSDRLNDQRARRVHETGANFLFADGHVQALPLPVPGRYGTIQSYPEGKNYQPRAH